MAITWGSFKGPLPSFGRQSFWLRRHDAVELFLCDARTRDQARAQLAEVGDIERLAVRTAVGLASPRDLGVIRNSLRAIEALHADADLAGLGVLEGVVQGLLGDAIKLFFQLRRQRKRIGRYQAGFNAGAVFHHFEASFKRSGKT